MYVAKEPIRKGITQLVSIMIITLLEKRADLQLLFVIKYNNQTDDKYRVEYH